MREQLRRGEHCERRGAVAIDGAFHQATVSVTSNGDGTYASTVLVDEERIANRTKDAFPSGTTGAATILVGAAFAGTSGVNTDVDIDDVSVELK